MNKLTLAATSIAAIAAAGVAYAEPRTVSDFTSVSAEAGLNVDVSVGPNFSVDVSGRDADRVTTRVSGQTLIVRPISGFTWGRRDVHITVVMPHVAGLEASSGARIRAEGLDGGNVELDSSSGAQLTASGTCAHVDADASSGAHIDASGLACATGSVDASSGARASVNVDGRLDIDASSGGDIYVSGTPEMGDISLSSGGTLHRR